MSELVPSQRENTATISLCHAHETIPFRRQLQEQRKRLQSQAFLQDYVILYTRSQKHIFSFCEMSNLRERKRERERETRAGHLGAMEVLVDYCIVLWEFFSWETRSQPRRGERSSCSHQSSAPPSQPSSEQCLGSGTGFRGLLDPDSESGSRVLRMNTE